MMTIMELSKALTPEQQAKAAECATAEELLAFARRESLPLVEVDVEEVLRMLHPPAGEFTDDELDAIAGGVKPMAGK